MKMKSSLLMPGQCTKCGSLFDIWYDLLSEEQIVQVEGFVGKRTREDEFLCWNCRKSTNLPQEDFSSENEGMFELEVEFANFDD